MFFCESVHGENVNIETAVNGYAAVNKSSYKLRDGRNVIQYKCDRGGVDRNRHGISEEHRMRNGKGSVLIDCPFRAMRPKEKCKASNHIIDVPGTKSHL